MDMILHDVPLVEAVPVNPPAPASEDDLVARKRSTTCPESRTVSLWSSSNPYDCDYVIDDEGHPVSPRSAAAAFLAQGISPSSRQPIPCQHHQFRSTGNTIDRARKQMDLAKVRATEQLRNKYEAEKRSLRDQHLASLAQKDNEIKALKEKMKELKAENERLLNEQKRKDQIYSNELSVYKQEMHDLKAENEKLKTDNMSLEQRIDAVYKEIESFENETEALKEDVRVVNAEKEELGLELAAIKEAKSKLDQANNELVIALTEKQQTLIEHGREMYQTQMIAENLRARLLKATSADYMRRWEAKMRRKSLVSGAGESPKAVEESERKIRRSKSMNDMWRVKNERERSQQGKRIAETRRMAARQQPPIVGDDEFWMNWLNLWFNARAKL